MPNHDSEKYAYAYRFTASDELRKAEALHQQHHYPESTLDGKTVPYSVADEKHKGRR